MSIMIYGLKVPSLTGDTLGIAAQDFADWWTEISDYALPAAVIGDTNVMLVNANQEAVNMVVFEEGVVTFKHPDPDNPIEGGKLFVLTVIDSVRWFIKNFPDDAIAPVQDIIGKNDGNTFEFSSEGFAIT